MNRPGSLLRWLIAAVVILLVTVPKDAHATDFYVEGTASGGASEWQDDPNGQGGLHLGFEFLDIVSIDVLMRLGYANVDERLLTTVGLGTKLALPFERFIPYLRATALHSHEMPVAAMSHDTFEHVMGVGDGTRHRFGVEGALGFSVVMFKRKKTALLAEAEAFVDGFPDEKGPVVYGGGGLGLGVQVGL